MRFKKEWNGIITWLKKQPQDKEFNYLEDCILETYLKSRRYRHATVGGTTYGLLRLENINARVLPKVLEYSAAEARPLTPRNMLACIARNGKRVM